jgi:phage portal protein BeeE
MAAAAAQGRRLQPGAPANIEASNLDYLMTALMGWVTGIEQECTFKLLTIAEQAAGFYVEANTNALLRGDTSQRKCQSTRSPSATAG